MIHHMLTEIPEEDKVSGFGDYGDSSDEDDSDARS